MKQPINISAPNKESLPFPHYVRNEDNFTYDVLQKPDEQLSVGDKVYNPKIGGRAEIIKKDTLWKAKGDWSAYGFTPIVAKITISQPQPK